ncbi:copper amine oxidase domain-containing protein [Gottschalkia acidurici 9a]|uniref:Copper amine oxidase domain-containing protein n=1 Tax=Gottschalkia acidurici (strain ATCC 7906 / DSM 604 / BCRC 14475 / CIP 104303 / KCTC 5404 / NCIMB 10678 / 9a) TaxID=1128398 RepID=K0B3A5_GOTA9|nr:stalk domain-containing protein [Gottschalkia acidurici]AFS79662.1 copper amine oxidase domain-containing protein [Gottschalkia acidurici 9a]
MKKKVVAISLSACILLSSQIYASQLLDSKLYESRKSVVLIEENAGISDSRYNEYEGIIKEIIESNGRLSILVEIENNDTFEKAMFKISDDVILLSDKTKDFINHEDLKEGAKINVFCNEKTDTKRNISPILNPSVIVVNEAEELTPVKVSKFNEELISIDNQLKLNISDKTILIDRNESLLNEEDIYNKDLIVFYGPSVTMSIPGQTSANKIIALKPKIKVLDKVLIDKKEKALKNNMYTSKGVTMIPLREISESLGYKVSWNKENKLAGLSKGNKFIKVGLNEDKYSFEKMILKLGAESEVKDGTTYVPLDFTNKVLKLNLEVSEDGTILIDKE